MLVMLVSHVNSLLCRLVFSCYVGSYDKNHHQGQVEFPFQVFVCVWYVPYKNSISIEKFNYAKK